MNYILRHKAYGRDTVNKIISNMHNECKVITDMNDYGENATIINWGNYISNDDSLFKVNKPSACKLASNKLEARKILSRECLSPITYFDVNDIKFPVIARPSQHCKGKYFYVLNNNRDLIALSNVKDILSGWYFSEIFNKTNEYRVHVAHGKILAIQEKPLNEGEIRANRAITENSWTYINWGNYITNVCFNSIKACTLLGLNYGAVDIMYNKAIGTCQIAEVNTSPTLHNYTSKRYAMYFDWLIDNNFPLHHMVNSNVGKDYSWKNNF